MKNLGLASLASVIVLTGCMDGGGDGTLYGLTAGDYLTSNGAVLADGCQIGFTGDDFNGDILTVSTADGVVIVDGESFPRSGNSFGSTTLAPGQQVNATCTVDLQLVFSGGLVANDAFIVSQRIDVSNPMGAGCAGAIPVTLPCSTQISFRADLQ